MSHVQNFLGITSLECGWEQTDTSTEFESWWENDYEMGPWYLTTWDPFY